MSLGSGRESHLAVARNAQEFVRRVLTKYNKMVAKPATIDQST